MVPQQAIECQLSLHLKYITETAEKILSPIINQHVDKAPREYREDFWRNTEVVFVAFHDMRTLLTAIIFVSSQPDQPALEAP